MIINICGVRDSDNISAVSDLDIDWIGFVFWQESPRYVRQISSRAGTIPDYSSLKEDPVLIKDANFESGRFCKRYAANDCNPSGQLPFGCCATAW